MKYLVLPIILLCTCMQMATGQTIEELQAEKKEKEAELKAIQGEIANLKAQIEAFPGWETGIFGTLGYNLSSFNNWQKGANPNAVSSSIRATANAFANYDQDRLFWRNSLGLNLGWQKLDTDADDAEDAEFEQVADVLRLQSLFGYTLFDHLAMSTLLDYNTSILSNFNNPGILDLGIGFTWTPLTDLVIVVHPLNQHWVFGDNPDFNDALGAKLVASYKRELVKGLNWNTNLTAFLPYSSSDPSLSEWTWINSFGFNLWKGIGVGFDFGLRSNKQEALNYSINTLGNTGETFDSVDNELQSYWLFGLSYAF